MKLSTGFILVLLAVLIQDSTENLDSYYPTINHHRLHIPQYNYPDQHPIQIPQYTLGFYTQRPYPRFPYPPNPYLRFPYPPNPYPGFPYPQTNEVINPLSQHLNPTQTNVDINPPNQHLNPPQTNPERTNPPQTNVERSNPPQTNVERSNPSETNVEQTNPSETNVEQTNRPQMNGPKLTGTYAYSEAPMLKITNTGGVTGHNGTGNGIQAGITVSLGTRLAEVKGRLEYNNTGGVTGHSGNGNDGQRDACVGLNCDEIRKTLLKQPLWPQ